MCNVVVRVDIGARRTVAIHRDVLIDCARAHGTEGLCRSGHLSGRVADAIGTGIRSREYVNCGSGIGPFCYADCIDYFGLKDDLFGDDRRLVGTGGRLRDGDCPRRLGAAFQATQLDSGSERDHHQDQYYDGCAEPEIVSGWLIIHEKHNLDMDLPFFLD